MGKVVNFKTSFRDMLMELVHQRNSLAPNVIAFKYSQRPVKLRIQFRSKLKNTVKVKYTNQIVFKIMGKLSECLLTTIDVWKPTYDALGLRQGSLDAGISTPEV